jgi:hypothetical protein
VDVRLSREQLALRDSAAVVVDRLGLHTVADFDDVGRTEKLEAAVTASGWRELRAASDDDIPLASAVEVAVVAEELGRGLADVAFFGPTLAADLRRLVGAPSVESAETIVLSADLSAPTQASGYVLAADCVAVDAGVATTALVLMAGAGAAGVIALEEPGRGVDLTRPAALCRVGTSISELAGQTRSLDAADLLRWQSLGLAVACADLVGIMRGAIDLASDYARQRKQYGATIGSFQAVQHLLADAQVSMEGAKSIALHAAWAVDALPGSDALAVAAGAKAYCTRAARAVCETAIQVHGGIGNTWECLAHVYLRRALLSGELLGGIGASLEKVLAGHGLGGEHGLR